ncbi:MAG: endonuclease/exonuclease/phosphatase family protein [Micrococcaceae bacterium]
MKPLKATLLIALSLAGALFLIINRFPITKTTTSSSSSRFVFLQNLLLLAQNFLPWFGLLSIFFIFLAFLYRKQKAAILLLAFPLVAALMFIPQLLPTKANTASNALTVATSNIDADNKDPQAAVQSIIAQNADLVGIEELEGTAGEEVVSAMNAAYPYNHVFGTVALWSKYPITDGEAADMPTNYGRVLTSEVDLPQGKTQVYVSHMGSYRPSEHAQRDEMLDQISQVMKTDPNDKAIIMGDFNASTYDSHFQEVLHAWPETKNEHFGMGFTWPTFFPATKIDHVFYKGFTNGTSHTFTAQGSDHKAIKATIS